MDDSAVPAGLVSCPVAFFFENHDAGTGLPLKDCPGHGQADNASSDYGIIIMLHEKGPGCWFVDVAVDSLVRRHWRR
jgi:hypothetical protein